MVMTIQDISKFIFVMVIMSRLVGVKHVIRKFRNNVQYGAP